MLDILRSFWNNIDFSQLGYTPEPSNSEMTAIISSISTLLYQGLRFSPAEIRANLVALPINSSYPTADDCFHHLAVNNVEFLPVYEGSEFAIVYCPNGLNSTDGKKISF